MILKANDIEILVNKLRVKNEDINQIIRAAKTCKIIDNNGKHVAMYHVLSLFGRERFLRALNRAAFHRTGTIFDGYYVDCSSYFDS